MSTRTDYRVPPKITVDDWNRLMTSLRVASGSTPQPVEFPYGIRVLNVQIGAPGNEWTNVLSRYISTNLFHLYFFGGYNKQPDVTEVLVLFGYNSDVTNFSFFSKWSGTNRILMKINNDAVSDGETVGELLVNVGGTRVLKRVYVGPPDSGGTGYRVLRVTN